LFTLVLAAVSVRGPGHSFPK